MEHTNRVCLYDCIAERDNQMDEKYEIVLHKQGDKYILHNRKTKEDGTHVDLELAWINLSDGEITLWPSSGIWNSYHDVTLHLCDWTLKELGLKPID